MAKKGEKFNRTYSNTALREKANEEVWLPNDVQQRQLDAMLDPDNFGKTKTELIEISGVSRPAFYKNLYNPDFRRFYAECFRAVKETEAVETFYLIKQCAKNPDNFQDRDLLAEITGLKQPKQAQTAVNVNVNNNIPDLKALSTEELEKMALDMGVVDVDWTDIDE